MTHGSDREVILRAEFIVPEVVLNLGRFGYGGKIQKTHCVSTYIKQAEDEMQGVSDCYDSG